MLTKTESAGNFHRKLPAEVKVLFYTEGVPIFMPQFNIVVTIYALTLHMP